MKLFFRTEQLRRRLRTPELKINKKHAYVDFGKMCKAIENETLTTMHFRNPVDDQTEPDY